LLARATKEFETSEEYKRIDCLNRELDDVTEHMRLNIESVVDRGEKISLLVDKADNLNGSSKRFRSQTRLRKFKVRLDQYKKTLIVVIAALVNNTIKPKSSIIYGQHLGDNLAFTVLLTR
jgi:hypothetical protein